MKLSLASRMEIEIKLVFSLAISFWRVYYVPGTVLGMWDLKDVQSTFMEFSNIVEKDR